MRGTLRLHGNGVFCGERTTTAVGVQPKRVQRINRTWTGLRRHTHGVVAQRNATSRVQCPKPGAFGD
jgi:hypothetical protein